MSNPFEIKLKEEKEPTLWLRLLQWLKGGSRLPVQQVPKTGTNTDILLSKTQRMELKQAVESPLERSSDTTTLIRRSDAGSDSQLII